MGSASREAVDRFTARPKGATPMIQYDVAVLEKATIRCGLRLVLDHLGSSESNIFASLDH